MRTILRGVLFGNLGVFLALAFALSQSFLILWLLVVWLDRPLFDTPAWAVASALLAAGHYLALGRRRDSKVLTHCFTPAAQAYVLASFSSCIVAAAIAAVSAGGLVASAMLGWAGPAHGLAFTALRAVSGAAGGLALATVLAGIASARRMPVARHETIEIPGLADGMAGLRIAHLSDLHIGNGVDIRRLERIVEAVNGVGADLVAITGDLFDRDAAVVEAASRALGKLRARCGVFAVLGNHDAYTGLEQVAARLAENAQPLRLLRGEVVQALETPSLFVAGIDDPGEDWQTTAAGEAAVAALAAKLPGHGTKVLLVHRPDVFPLAIEAGCDLVLAGHYHGGQIAVPGSRDRLNPARLLSERFSGTHRLGGAVLHVSRGVGCTGPRLRIASPPEFSVLELVPLGSAHLAPAAASSESIAALKASRG